MNTFFGSLVIQLPRSITPTVAGLTVGAFVGVVGFLAVMLLVGRGNKKTAPRRAPSYRLPRAPDGSLYIPTYPTIQRDTPLPPAAFRVAPGSNMAIPVAQPARARNGVIVPPPAVWNGEVGNAGHTQAFVSRGASFRPSTDLSARALAKMYTNEDQDSPASDPLLAVDWTEMQEDELEEDEMPASAVPVSFAPGSILPPFVVQNGPPSQPHPGSIIRTGSVSMAPAVATPPGGASIADLDMDDGQTEIAETRFDEPPQPRRRTDPPKIRAVAPSGPRFVAALPQTTPPPRARLNGRA